MTSGNPLPTTFSMLDRLVAAGDVAGCALAVARGDARWTHVAGMAAPGRAADAATLWPLASISKLYTAATIMALVERGVLTLGMFAREIVPAFVGDGREHVAIRHLLTHASGLIYESPEMERLLTALTPLDAIVDEVNERLLLFPPGAKLSYSDLGYALLGRIAATATGTPFPHLVRELVLEPGGLTETFIPPPASEYGRIAHITGAFGEGTPGAMYNSAYARELAHPAFGAIATVEDLLRFGLLFAAFSRSRLLSAATVRAMTIDQTNGYVRALEPAAETDAPYPWGLGFMVKGRLSYPELLSPAAFGHDGATGCALWIDPAHDFAIAFASNRHLNTIGMHGVVQRLSTIVNTVVAGLTRFN